MARQRVAGDETGEISHSKSNFRLRENRSLEPVK
jgi:hypothetical protein